ncbi:MAG: DUF3754 domain-containing protein [Planctomycetia bacterium]|nr:DUF3754 domain-containing protein [Planctomycetia bacterium]
MIQTFATQPLQFYSGGLPMEILCPLLLMPSLSMSVRMLNWLIEVCVIREPELSFLDQTEHFIPVRYEYILEKIHEDPSLSLDEKQKIKQMGDLFENIFHHECFALHKEARNNFVPFNPDKETVCEREFSPEEQGKCRDELMKVVKELLTVGNYSLLKTDELNQCLKMQPLGSLSVSIDTRKFERFDVYYRGVQQKTLEQKILVFFKRERSVREFKRVCVLAQYKKEFGEVVLIKLFRNVLVENLKIVAPSVKLSLSPFSLVKISATGLSGLSGIVLAIIKGVALFSFTLAALAGAIVTALMKAVFSFLNTRTKCLQIYTASLYNQSLANNLGAIDMLIEQGEIQEIKEALLAYMFLYIHRGKHLTMDEIDKAAEKWLRDNFDYEIDFEVDDAIRKLVEKSICRCVFKPSLNEPEPKEPEAKELPRRSKILYFLLGPSREQREIMLENWEAQDQYRAARYMWEKKQEQCELDQVFSVLPLDEALKQLRRYWMNLGRMGEELGRDLEGEMHAEVRKIPHYSPQSAQRKFKRGGSTQKNTLGLKRRAPFNKMRRLF